VGAGNDHHIFKIALSVCVSVCLCVCVFTLADRYTLIVEKFFLKSREKFSQRKLGLLSLFGLADR
jgi:hypothetical protein